MRSLTAVNAEPVIQAFRDNAVVILAALALVMGAICARLLRRLARARAQLVQAQAAAEEAARAAALAAPGGIDPEAVLEVLRRGVAPTLDNIYATMQRHDARARAEQPVAPKPEAGPTPETVLAAGAAEVSVSPPG